MNYRTRQSSWRTQDGSGKIPGETVLNIYVDPAPIAVRMSITFHQRLQKAGRKIQAPVLSSRISLQEWLQNSSAASGDPPSTRIYRDLPMTHQQRDIEPRGTKPHRLAGILQRAAKSCDPETANKYHPDGTAGRSEIHSRRCSWKHVTHFDSVLICRMIVIQKRPYVYPTSIQRSIRLFFMGARQNWRL